MAQPLDLLAKLGDKVGVDVVEVQGGLEQAQRTVDRERVEIRPDYIG